MSNERKPFAPGVITGGDAPAWRLQTVTAMRWAWRLVSVLCVLIVVLGLIGLARQEVRSGEITTSQACGRGLM